MEAEEIAITLDTLEFFTASKTFFVPCTLVWKNLFLLPNGAANAAQWTTISQSLIQSDNVSKSLISQRFILNPSSDKDLIFISESPSPSTEWLSFVNRYISAEPKDPVAPVTTILIISPLRYLMRNISPN